MEWKFERVAGPHVFTEGPIWTGEFLLFTDIANSRIMRFDPKSGECIEFRTGTNRANGLALNAGGALYACEGGLDPSTSRMDEVEAPGRRIALYPPRGRNSSDRRSVRGKPFQQPQ